MNGTDIGFTSVTFRQKTVDGIIKTALTNGVGRIEWGGDVHVPDIKTAKKVNALCRENGIVPISLGSYYRFGAPDAPDFAETAERTAALGADRVRVWLGVKPSAEYTRDEVKRLMSDVAKADETAQSYGVSIAFEFHRKTLNDNGASSRAFLSACPPSVTTYWQPFFEKCDEVNLSLISRRVSAAHVFSWDAGCRRFPLEAEYRFWSRAVAALKKTPCRDLILEFVRDDSDEAFAHDVACLKKIAAET